MKCKKILASLLVLSVAAISVFSASVEVFGSSPQQAAPQLQFPFTVFWVKNSNTNQKKLGGRPDFGVESLTNFLVGVAAELDYSDSDKQVLEARLPGELASQIANNGNQRIHVVIDLNEEGVHTEFRQNIINEANIDLHIIKLENNHASMNFFNCLAPSLDAALENIANGVHELADKVDALRVKLEPYFMYGGQPRLKIIVFFAGPLMNLDIQYLATDEQDSRALNFSDLRAEGIV
jgi:hypothetical protein